MRLVPSLKRVRPKLVASRLPAINRAPPGVSAPLRAVYAKAVSPVLSKTGAILAFASPRRHIRAKIILPYAVLCFILAAVGTYLVTQLVAGSLQERFDNQLAEAGQVASDAVVRTEQRQLESARAMAYTKGMPEAVQRGDLSAVLNLVSPVAANQGTERVEVVDAQGKPLTDLVGEDAPAVQQTGAADTPGSWGIVQQVLAGGDTLGDKYAALVQTNRGFYLFTAAPVKVQDQTVGAVLVGTSLESLVADVKSQAFSDVTFYSYDGEPLASTFVLPETGNDGASLVMNSDLTSNVLNMEAASPRDSRTLFGRDYDFVYGRLVVRQTAVGLYSVALPTNFIISAGATTRTNLSLLFGGVITAVLVIGYLLARRITNPILRLAKASRAVAAGDLETRSGIRSSDEIGLLARSFDLMTESLERHTERLRVQNVNTVKAFTSAVDARDPYTLGHSLRVGRLSALLARRLGLSDEVCDQIELGGYLHDIGKIGVRDAVLLKPGPLTSDERVGIDLHPLVGCRILEPLDLPAEILQFVRSHHERLDGSGYPEGLKGDDVSIVARIAGVADIYDAMTSLRPYKTALSSETALSEIKSQSGTTLDSRVIASLEEILPEWERQRQSDASLRSVEIETVGPEEHRRRQRWQERDVA